MYLLCEYSLVPVRYVPANGGIVPEFQSSKFVRLTLPRFAAANFRKFSACHIVIFLIKTKFVSMSKTQQVVSLRLMSHQNHLAAIKIQKVHRGHYHRLLLWKYGGILMVSCVAKIQRCWRGLQVF